MKKKLVTIMMATLMCTSLAACSLKPSEVNRPQDVETVDEKDDKEVDEKEDEEGFETSDEVIKAYWQAFADVKKSAFRECFPDPDKAKKGVTNIEDTVDAQYETAKAAEDSVEIDLESIEIESENFDVEDVENGLGKLYDISKAKKSTVTVPMKQEVDGQIYDVEDIYEIVTVKIDGYWYISTVDELDARIVDSTEDPEGTKEIFVTIPEDPDEQPTTEVGDPVSVSETDYSKVNWGVTYPIDGYEGLTISVTPYVDDYGIWYLIVGATNVYDTQITLSATAQAKDSTGAVIGDTFAYMDIGSGNTNLFKIRCEEGKTPNGEIHWEDIKISESYRTYVPWVADWNISSPSDGELKLDYTITMADTATVGQVYGLLLDSKGYVIDVFDDYIGDKGKTMTDDDTMYRSDIMQSGAADVAFFANPTK